GRQRLLHFYDHLRLLKQFFGGIDDLCAGRDVILISESGTNSRALLHEHRMAAAGQGGRGSGNESNAMFLLLNFFRDADDHAGDSDMGRVTSDKLKNAATTSFLVTRHSSTVTFLSSVTDHPGRRPEACTRVPDPA